MDGDSLIEDVSELWERLGAAPAEEAVEALTVAFYRGVAADPLLRPMYPEEDLTGAQERLALFLTQRFGGPATYSEQRGHPRLRMRHAPFPVDLAAIQAWLGHMFAAIDATPALASHADPLRRYFRDAAFFLQNRAPNRE